MNLIVTASDRKYGDFLCEHWLASLVACSSLESTTLVVLDYGLSKVQRFYLENHRVRLLPCERDGHPAILRYRDLGRLLSQESWDQVMLCDGGDLIFQQDPLELFSRDREFFRGVVEDIAAPFTFYLSPDYFREVELPGLRRSLRGKPMVNGGMILGPREKMVLLCARVTFLVKDPNLFGPDQVVVNEVFHKMGFMPLDRGWNFIIATADEDFFIREGTFCRKDGSLIPVIHNAGNLGFLRPVENFGFGREYNRLKEDLLRSLKMVHRTGGKLLRTTEEWAEARDRLLAGLQEANRDSKIDLVRNLKRLRHFLGVKKPNS